MRCTHHIPCFSHLDVVREAELLAERDERLALPLVPDFDDDEGEAEIDEAAMYAKIAYEAQMAKEKEVTSRSKQNQPIQKKKTPLIIEIENGSQNMSVEVENPFEDIDVQIVGQKEGTPTPTLNTYQAI